MTAVRDLSPNCTLTAGIGECPISVPCRVLGVDDEERVWTIEIPSREKSGKTPPYARAPTYIDLAILNEFIGKGSLVVGQFEVPNHWKMTDDDYVEAALNNSERSRRKRRQDRRDAAWAVIKPIVGNSTAMSLAMRSSSMRSAIEERAHQCSVSLPTVYNFLHRYLAYGSVTNGLLPATTHCGAPGKERVQGTKRLGRPRSTHVATTSESPAFILSDESKEWLGLGYALVSQECTVREAFDRTNGAFWSNRVVNADGSITTTLLPIDKRPTITQFKYWGAKMMTPDDRAKRVGFGRRSNATTHHGGSSQDLTVAVGQLGMLDSTSTDVYLTSRLSRLRVLPPPHRTAVLDVRSTVYLGFHVGWQAPSPNTGLLAILNGALSPEEKVKIALHYGVESTVDQWPCALCRTYLTDNGELRAAEATDAERQFLFSISFTKTYHGAGKGDVESLHHYDHLKLDHRIPGTTRGKQRERGETPPANRALWNFYEYMREFIRHVLHYNNFVDVPSLAPAAMLAAGIRPTRMNIFRWLMNLGQRADIPCDIEQLRAFTLTKWPATIEHNGIFLKSEDGKRKLPLARFYNASLLDDPQFQAARKTRLVTKTTVRLDPSNPRQIWLPRPMRFIELENVAREKTQRDLSVWELEAMLDDNKTYADEAQQNNDQASFEETSRRQGTTQNAKAERDRELKEGRKKLSKTAARSHLRENVNSESKLAPEFSETRPDRSEESCTDQQEIQSANRSSEAARSAQRSFMEGLE